MTEDLDPAPEATKSTPESQQQVDPVQELAALKAKYERAQKDLQTFRTRAEQVEAAQKAAADKALAEADATKRAELLQARVAELEKAQADALAKATAAERRAALAGKVVDPVAALKLLDATRHLDGDGNPDVEKILADYPFLAPCKSDTLATPVTTLRESSPSGRGGNPAPYSTSSSGCYLLLEGWMAVLSGAPECHVPTRSAVGRLPLRWSD